jgi:hypothetical protein
MKIISDAIYLAEKEASFERDCQDPELFPALCLRGTAKARSKGD